MNIWKIAPGENAYQWEECRDHGFIGLGWDDLGYIRGVPWEEFVRRCQDAYGLAEESLKSQGVYQLWRFVHEIKVGDRIIANRGTRRIIGIGTITGELFWVKDGSNRHRFPVEWADTQEYAVDEPGWRKTLIPLSDEKFQELWQSQGNIWKVAPGEGAVLWAEFQAKKCIGIGWDDMGDIRGLSWEDFAKRAMQTYDLQETQIKTHGVYQIWKFVNDIKPGDQIIANQGTKKILGIGTVTGESFWVEEGPLRNRLPVKWEHTDPIEIDEPSWVKTLAPLSPEKLHRILSKKDI